LSKTNQMKLLIITQKVDINDDLLGFFCGWLDKLAGKIEKIYVICLEEGRHNLPKNVKIFSLGKEKGFSKIHILWNFYRYLFKIIRHTDVIFAHMCPIYIIACAPLAKIFKKKMILWCAHIKIGLKGKIAEKLVSKVLTVSKDSFTYKSKKIITTGHGINTSFFVPAKKSKNKNKKRSQILSIGRISPVKDYMTLTKAIDILVNEKKIENIEALIIGSPPFVSQEVYYEKIKDFICRKKLNGYIKFLGKIPNKDTLKYYQQADIFVSMQRGGGAGKSVLEAMACGVPIVLCTNTFDNSLGNFKKEIIFEEKNSQDLAKKILNCLNFSEVKKDNYSNLLRNIVIKNHNLDNLVEKFKEVFET